MERIKLNLIPSGVAPIVHLSQYDDGRKFGIDLFEGESVYVLDGTETLTVNSRKPDGHVVVIAVTNTGTSSLDVDTVEQLTAVHGVSYAKLQIVKGSVTIATLPFLIDVSRDPLENGDPSESFIQNLETQVSEMVAEDVATQYDSANVIFDNAPTSGHGTPYTVTSEGIKTAIDNAFDYDNTASGSIVHITDGADNIPVKSLVSQIVAVENGNGQPKSPTNPYTISGFDNGIVSVCGVNLFGGTYNNNYQLFIPKNIQFTISAVVSGGSNLRFAVFDKNEQQIDYWAVSAIESGRNYRTFNLPYDVHFVKFYYADSATNLQIAFGTDTQYHAYNGNTYTFAFGQTVYGGYFDNKGNLVVTHGYIASYNGETINEPWLSSMDNYVPNTSPSTGAQVVYPLTTPTTLSITSQDIPTLLGENNIFSNCGDVEVEYYTNKANDILEFIDSEIGKKNGTNIPIEANSQDSIKDYIDDEVSTINTSLSGKADKTEDATITVESGYTLISSSCGKTDRLVHLNFNVEKTGGFATGWQVIGTTEFKPNTLVYCPLWNVTNGMANGEVRIDTDGTINFYVVTAGELRLNANIGYVTS